MPSDLTACPDRIDCCPPTPFDYLILEPLFFNTLQCATAACVTPPIPDDPNIGVILDEKGNPELDEGGAPILQEGASPPRSIQWCVQPGTFSGSTQVEADQKAYDYALAQAEEILSHTNCKNIHSWCCIVTCVSNPDGSFSHIFNYSIDEPPEFCQKNRPVNQGRGYVKAGTVDTDANAQTQATNLALEDLGACVYQNDELWCVATCGGINPPLCPPDSDAECVYSAPVIDPATQVMVHVVYGQFTSTLNKHDANVQACCYAKSQIASALATCQVAGRLSGLTWQLPSRSLGPVAEASPTVACDHAVEFSTTMGGTAGSTYLCTLLIRGCVEMKGYNGTAADIVSGTNEFARKCSPCSDFTGPIPTKCCEVLPVTPDCADPYTPFPPGLTQVPRPMPGVANIYMLLISDDGNGNPSIYYLNNIGPVRVPNKAYALDDTHNISDNSLLGNGYQFQVKIKAGATVTLRADSIECVELNDLAFGVSSSDTVTGHPLKITNDHAPLQPYFGQWMQMDCLSAVPTTP